MHCLLLASYHSSPTHRSSIVERVLLSAWKDGKRFSVVVVDSRPMLEGTWSPFITIFIIDLMSRQMLATSLDCYFNTLHIPSASRNRINHHRSQSGAGRRTLAAFQRCRVLPGRDSIGGNDGQTTLGSGLGMLRDIQICRRGSTRQFHQE
jgi:hypothetical protein